MPLVNQSKTRFLSPFLALLLVTPLVMLKKKRAALQLISAKVRARGSV